MMVDSSHNSTKSTQPEVNIVIESRIDCIIRRLKEELASETTIKKPVLNDQNLIHGPSKLRDIDPLSTNCQSEQQKTRSFLIKRLDLEKFDDIDLKLTLNDIHTCNQLRHPNILQYWYNFVYNQELCIVAPLCHYTSADRLSRPFGLPELAIAFIIKDTLLALDYLHHKGIIHRSLKGSNLLINESGRCLLSGFKYSISCIVDGKRLPYLHEYPAKARPIINWFSPEILEQNLFGYNQRTDIYSLGITCCELANGVVPFSDLQPTEMLLDKLTGNNPRLLDSTCQELLELRPNEMTSEDRDRYFVFRGREFSQSFHTFVVGLCLNFDPQKRPDAKKLLSSHFIKQLKRSPASCLLEFIGENVQAREPV